MIVVETWAHPKAPSWTSPTLPQRRAQAHEAVHELHARAPGVTVMGTSTRQDSLLDYIRARRRLGEAGASPSTSAPISADAGADGDVPGHPGHEPSPMRARGAKATTSSSWCRGR